MQTGDASLHESSPVNQYKWLDIRVWFEGDRCNGPSQGSIGFGSLNVDYVYRGRQRTGTVDLGAQYSVFFEEGCSQADRAADEELDRAWGTATGGHFDTIEFLNNPQRSTAGHLDLGSVLLEPVAVSRDLCRYLRGIQMPAGGIDYSIEPLQARAVFRAKREDAAALIDGAVLGICPEFANQRDALHELLEAIQT